MDDYDDGIAVADLLDLVEAPPSPKKTRRKAPKKRERWTTDEDCALIEFFLARGPLWREMAKTFKKRTDDSYRNRYLRLHGLGHVKRGADVAAGPRAQRREWTPSEDERILKLMPEYTDPSGQVRWHQVERFFEGRSAHAIRNRSYRLLHKAGFVDCS